MYEPLVPRFTTYGEPNMLIDYSEIVPMDCIVDPNLTPRLREVSEEPALVSLTPEELEQDISGGYELPYTTCKKDTGKARLYLARDGFNYWIPIACILRDDMLDGVVTVIQSFKLKPL